MSKDGDRSASHEVLVSKAPSLAAGPLAAVSAEWLLVTLSCIGDGVITTDPRGLVTFMNPTAQALTGWTQEEATAGGGVSVQTVFNIINEVTRVNVESPTVRALREGLIVGLANHTILIARDGTERNIDDNAAPIKDARGVIAGAVLCFRDVTEHKRQEKLAQEAVDFATNILETQREPFLVLDKDLRVVSANRSFYKSFRVEKDATQGRFVYDLGDGQWNIPALRELLEDVLPRDHAFEGFEVEHDFPAGVGRKTILINARRLCKPGDDSELILLAIEDVTARKQADQAQRDSEVRYRRLFESAKDGVLIMDAQTGKITDANPFMCGLTGLERSEILGKELHEIGMFKDADENKAAFRELQSTGYIRHEHLPVQNRRGERVEVEFVANVYKEGDSLVAQCNVRDISERILLQQQVAKQAAVLAQQARSKDEFLAMLSHELRNPLAPIRAAAHLMRLQERGGLVPANPILQEAREVIERQVANLTKMVSDLSEVSRVISGRIRLDLRAVDMKQVVEHAVQSATPLFEQRKHTVSVSACSEPVWAYADATRLEEVLVNLLNNAAKYTPDGGRIAVSCELRHEGGKDYAMVRVRDNGVGIEETLLPRVFDLFTQGERSLDRAWGGLGIGLSLAHRLMTMHGGTIAAHSAGAGKGSEFSVKLPLLAAPRTQGASAGPSLGTEAASLTSIEGEAVKESAGRVLVVDDNIDLVTMLCGTLRLKGFIVQSAYTGPEGLRIAQEWRPEVALLDIGLPGLDGYEIARRLRAEDARAPEAAGPGHELGGAAGTRMKLIAITGYGRDDDIALAKQAGFDGHLTKPVEFKDLERIMAAPAHR
ncbi:MAG: PAS domain S-box protein [Phycisphaerales bacterium]